MFIVLRPLVWLHLTLIGLMNCNKICSSFPVLLPYVFRWIWCIFFTCVLQTILHATCMQETSDKDLSTLAKAAFELLKWKILPRPFLENAVTVILSSVNDPNWRTRSASLSYIRTFMYRLLFLLAQFFVPHFFSLMVPY